MEPSHQQSSARDTILRAAFQSVPLITYQIFCNIFCILCRQADKNGDGKISFSEIVQIFKVEK